jgi:polysaccharide export outer membrane protein
MRKGIFMKKEVLFVLSAILLLALIADGKTFLFQQEIALPFTDYRIGPKDLLEIKIFELPELNQTVRVAEDGSVSLTMLGKVAAAGLTAQELEKRLASILDQQYTKGAHVTVFIKEYQKVAVLGAVARPGMYELAGPTTLLYLIAQAGGLTPQAMKELFIYRRGEDGRQTKTTIDLEDLINGNQDLNVEIHPNDVINIPVDRMSSVYVNGQVKAPGVVQFSSSKGLTLLQAIAQAGGTTDWAKTRRVVIKRIDKKTGSEMKITVNLKAIQSLKISDPPLQDGDVVIVP